MRQFALWVIYKESTPVVKGPESSCFQLCCCYISVDVSCSGSSVQLLSETVRMCSAFFLHTIRVLQSDKQRFVSRGIHLAFLILSQIKLKFVSVQPKRILGPQ